MSYVSLSSSNNHKAIYIDSLREEMSSIIVLQLDETYKTISGLATSSPVLLVACASGEGS
jgi:hypothetical protein